jgi:hypothetical protein
MKLVAIFEAGFVDYTRDDDGTEDDQQIDGEQGDEFDDSQQQPQDGEQGDEPNQAEDGEQGDPDRQGDLRSVPDAHLVYKRKNENNLYDELWIFKINQHDTWTMKTFDAIMAGTDIPKGSTTSDDGSQTVERWEVGDPKNTLVFVNIKGLTS